MSQPDLLQLFYGTPAFEMLPVISHAVMGNLLCKASNHQWYCISLIGRVCDSAINVKSIYALVCNVFLSTHLGGD